MRCGTTIARMLFCCGALWAVTAATPLCSQIRIVPRAKLDSLAHPATADGAEAMRFERTQIDAGHIGEDDTPPGLRPEPSFPALPAQLFFFSSAVCSAGASACGLPLRLTFGSFPAFWARRTSRSTSQATTARMTAHSSTSGR